MKGRTAANIVPFLAAAAVGPLFGSLSAQACTVAPQPPEVVAAQSYDAVSVGRTVSAQYDAISQAERGIGLRPWTASIRYERAIEGQPLTSVQQIHMGSLCDHKGAIARAGEAWALYFKRDSSGRLKLVAFLRMSQARRVDERF